MPMTHGGMAAQARPCTARQATSIGKEIDQPAPTIPTAIRPNAAIKVRRRPIRSPSQPDRGIATVNTNTKLLTTNTPEATSTPSPSVMVRNGTLTTLLLTVPRTVADSSAMSVPDCGGSVVVRTVSARVNGSPFARLAQRRHASMRGPRHLFGKANTSMWSMAKDHLRQHAQQRNRRLCITAVDAET